MSGDLLDKIPTHTWIRPIISNSTMPKRRPYCPRSGVGGRDLGVRRSVNVSSRSFVVAGEHVAHEELTTVGKREVKDKCSLSCEEEQRPTRKDTSANERHWTVRHGWLAVSVSVFGPCGDGTLSHVPR